MGLIIDGRWQSIESSSELEDRPIKLSNMNRRGYTENKLTEPQALVRQ